MSHVPVSKEAYQFVFFFGNKQTSALAYVTRLSNWLSRLGHVAVEVVCVLICRITFYGILIFPYSVLSGDNE